jgi:hypothetical protein
MELMVYFILLLLFGGTGFELRALHLLYHLSHTSSPFFSVCFEDGNS